MESIKFERSVYQIDIYGEAVKLRKPRHGEIREFSEKYSLTEDNKVKSQIMIELLETLGLPKGKTEELESDHLTSIIDLVMGLKKN